MNCVKKRNFDCYNQMKKTLADNILTLGLWYWWLYSQILLAIQPHIRDSRFDWIQWRLMQLSPYRPKTAAWVRILEVQSINVPNFLTEKKKTNILQKLVTCSSAPLLLWPCSYKLGGSNCFIKIPRRGLKFDHGFGKKKINDKLNVETMQDKVNLLS